VIDDTMRALADPTRREILRSLREGDLSAGDIASRFDMTAPSISHHLNVLKEAGLVQAIRNGRHIIYSLNSTVFQDFMQELLELMNRGGRS
jgi:ArsR family transcriptional regulator, arsenate/arsenite/antimonite-responsive transcriptional repressor